MENTIPRSQRAAPGCSLSGVVLLSGFLFTIALIVYVWRPLAVEYLAQVDWDGPWWLYLDRLLIGIFLFMSVSIVGWADLRADWLVIAVGLAGGLVIESWGTQTELWTYYTHERPPLWIIPAWPIASLSIDRLTRFLGWVLPDRFPRLYRLAYWAAMGGFYALMLPFVAPTFDKSFTWLAMTLSAVVIAAPGDRRTALLTFAAGCGLGYFLELWGTTRECWTYYTLQTPPLFAVLAHGLAALAFYRVGAALKAAGKTLAERWGDHRQLA